MFRLLPASAFADRLISKLDRGLDVHPPSTWIAAALLLAFAAVVWLPALGTPFWGDDYQFLQTAHAANVAGNAWWSAYWPETSLPFWRPLSEQTWWRFVDATLDADSRRTHWVSLALLALAAGCVGLLGLSIARALAWSQPGGTAVLSGMIHGLMALNFLPVHWAAAANSSILVIFTALILAAWVAAPRAGPVARAGLLACIPLLLIAALLSKESAVLVPALMLVLALFAGWAAYGRAERIVWLLCMGIVGSWLVLRARFTAGADPQYDLVLGTNLVRNGLSLVAWLFNVPREALRLVATGEAALGLAWAAIVAIPMVAAWVIAARLGLRQFTPRQILLTLTFCLLAYAPYLPLAWNSYAYYAAVAAMLPTIVLARGLAGRRCAIVAAVLIGMSSLVAVEGSRWRDNPGLIGRARWAEATFQSLAREEIGSELWVHTDDTQRFYSMGAAGLAWRLGLAPGSVHLVDRCPDSDHICLGIDGSGKYSWLPPYRGQPVQVSSEDEMILQSIPNPERLVP